MRDTTAFHTLSIALLSDAHLPPAAAAELAALLHEQLGPGLATVLARWDERPASEPPEAWLAAQLWSDASHRVVCEAIMLAWLFGAAPVKESSDVRWAQRWFEGRFWSYLRAHVPGVSGGYFGYWSYPPES